MFATEEQLISAVQNYPLLYDVDNQYYYDSIRKDKAWEEISLVLKEPVDSLKKRWTSLRDCFRKAIIKRKFCPYGNTSKFRPWKYEHQMSFLVDHFRQRNKISNNLTSEYDISNLENTKKAEPLLQEYNSFDETSSSYESRPDPAPQIPLSNPDTERNVKTPDVIVAAEYLKEYLEIKMQKTRSLDPIGKFFSAMEETVRTFSPALQIEVKSKISALITEYELKNLNNDIESHRLYSQSASNSDISYHSSNHIKIKDEAETE